MLLGGAMQLVVTNKLRARAPWCGLAVSAVSLVAYGIFALASLVVNGTTVGAVLFWAVALGMWFGIWLNRRERTRQV